MPALSLSQFYGRGSKVRSNEIRLLVHWGDTDMAGIVYYPNYFKWFDIAGHQFFRSSGLAPAKLDKEQNIILPILEAKCNFEKTLLYDEMITIRTKVEEVKRKTIKLKHEVYNSENERTGFGYEIRGWVKKEDNGVKAVQIPEDVRKILCEDVHTKVKENEFLFHT